MQTATQDIAVSPALGVSATKQYDGPRVFLFGEDTPTTLAAPNKSDAMLSLARHELRHCPTPKLRALRQAWIEELAYHLEGGRIEAEEELDAMITQW